MWGLGLQVEGLAIGVSGFGFRVSVPGFGFQMSSSRTRVEGLGLRVEG
jgi:hypothetical protein